jgi:Ca2+-binding RTX toxin-like protein
MAQSQSASSFGCRASAVRIDMPAPVGTIEPVRANSPGTPCTTSAVGVVYPTALGPVSADAVRALSAREGTGPGSALASANGTAIALPGLDVKVDAVQATATSSCSGTTPANTGTSRVAGLTINGNPVVLPPDDALLEIPLGPLGSVTLNKEIVDGAVLTRRAVEVVTPAATVVLAEAIAGHAAGACRDAAGNAIPLTTNTNTNTNTNTTTPAASASPDVCPPGATYDAGRNLCVIRENGTVIVVGPPFQGPSGGTVLSLAKARSKYKSVCLKGSGPKFAIVGTAGNDRITGTNRRDRILLLAGKDNAEGGRGDDCIDGGKGGDTMSGALGKDRIIGGSGNDHLVGGSHADFLQGGTGNDTIHSGFGKDKIDGGSGGDKINAATAGSASSSIRCGKGRDKIRVNRNEGRKARARKAGCERVYVIR